MSRKALVIFSGGQDSTTCLYWARREFDEVEAITFDYGQRHEVELGCAREICARLGVAQTIIDLSFFGSLNQNALTDASLALKTDGGFQNLPTSFVPGRNALFFTVAASYAVPRGFLNLVTGVCQTDYSGYPDCRAEFVRSMEQSLGLALDVKLDIHTPLMLLTKAETFELAKNLDALETVLEMSNTCYEGDRTHRHAWGYGCGVCPACELRAQGWEAFAGPGLASEINL